jgi:hypothetical protein
MNRTLTRRGFLKATGTTVALTLLNLRVLVSLRTRSREQPQPALMLTSYPRALEVR